MKFDLNNYPLIGMIHLPNLTENVNLEETFQYAISEASLLKDLGYSAVMIENFNDSPFAKSSISEDVLIKYSIILHEVNKQTGIPIGVNILRNACVQAMKVASVLSLPFIRCNVWEGAYITDQGIIEGAAYDVTETRRNLKSNTKILADIHVKHASPMGNFSLLESAENALLRGKADQLVVSGASTGRAPDKKKLKILSENNFKPIIGSGISYDNLPDYSKYISGAIIGTSIKIDQNVSNQIDKTLATNFIQLWRETFDSFS
ncbi:MAG: BtpA/SgcQ family protein [Candidatus Heimdallarchaeota archaeon]|nr:BtpA/SgcQ family protein [Candidatus Heimdallarchaeota archaeon]